MAGVLVCLPANLHTRVQPCKPACQVRQAGLHGMGAAMQTCLPDCLTTCLPACTHVHLHGAPARPLAGPPVVGNRRPVATQCKSNAAALMCGDAWGPHAQRRMGLHGHGHGHGYGHGQGHGYVHGYRHGPGGHGYGHSRGGHGFCHGHGYGHGRGHGHGYGHGHGHWYDHGHGHEHTAVHGQKGAPRWINLLLQKLWHSRRRWHRVRRVGATHAHDGPQIRAVRQSPAATAKS
eukprot:68654-Chlamydomonas_euryale.AAC.11